MYRESFHSTRYARRVPASFSNDSRQYGGLKIQYFSSTFNTFRRYAYIRYVDFVYLFSCSVVAIFFLSFNICLKICIRDLIL